MISVAGRITTYSDDKITQCTVELQLFSLLLPHMFFLYPFFLLSAVLKACYQYVMVPCATFPG